MIFYILIFKEYFSTIAVVFSVGLKVEEMAGWFIGV